MERTLSTPIRRYFYPKFLPNQADALLKGGVKKNSVVSQSADMECGVNARALLTDGRGKKFISFDSLLYERDRLQSFIDWPFPQIPPTFLAKEGYHYTRIADRCVCVFCFKLFMRQNYKKVNDDEWIIDNHDPKDCPFKRGQPVGNVPLSHSMFLDRLPFHGEEWPIPKSRRVYAGNKARKPVILSSGEEFLPGGYEEEKEETSTVPEYGNIQGLSRYVTPKIGKYSTIESRLKSYILWPACLEQTPQQLAEAGFYCCGVSDHVRCFHCGNGLKNWESGDEPWEQHARWYPECYYVILMKGQNFIEEIRKKKPPCLSFCSVDREVTLVKPSSGRFNRILIGSFLNTLMESDVIKAVENMNFSRDNILAALIRRLQRTGMPFFNIQSCIVTMMEEMKPNITVSNVSPSITVIPLSSTPECKICMNNRLEVVFLPCNHLVACVKCTSQLVSPHCPVCMQNIEHTVKAIIS